MAWGMYLEQLKKAIDFGSIWPSSERPVSQQSMHPFLRAALIGRGVVIIYITGIRLELKALASAVLLRAVHIVTVHSTASFLLHHSSDLGITSPNPRY